MTPVAERDYELDSQTIPLSTNVVWQAMLMLKLGKGEEGRGGRDMDGVPTTELSRPVMLTTYYSDPGIWNTQCRVHGLLTADTDELRSYYESRLENIKNKLAGDDGHFSLELENKSQCSAPSRSGKNTGARMNLGGCWPHAYRDHSGGHAGSSVPWAKEFTSIDLLRHMHYGIRTIQAATVVSRLYRNPYVVGNAKCPSSDISQRDGILR